jgi:hypothetical protein
MIVGPDETRGNEESYPCVWLIKHNAMKSYGGSDHPARITSL